MKNKLRFTILLSITLVYITGISFHIAYAKNKNIKKANHFYHIAITETSLLQKEYFLKKAHSLNPSDSKISFQLGRTLFLRKKISEGEKYLLLAANNKNYSHQAYKFLGEYFYEVNNLPKADKYLRILVKHHSEDNYLNNLLLGKINTHDGLKNYKDSNIFFSKAYSLRLQKNDYELLYYQAENYYYLNDFPNAIHYLSLYPHSNKNNQSAFRLLILSFKKSNQIDKLRQTIIEYRKVWPRDQWLSENL